MLTRDLLLYRVRQGRLRPLFVSATAPALLALAEALVAEVDAHAGRTRAELEEALALHAGAHARPRVARGLVKLLLDRVEFEEADPTVGTARLHAFHLAASLLRGLPPGAPVEAYEALLAEHLDAPLAHARERLYADLPGGRRLVRWERLGPPQLLERYNLALAQGHLLSARRLSVRARAPGLLRVRKVLRWLKFCRLVAEVRREGEDWALEVEGPGAVLSLHKRYGLQLATFLGAVPLLGEWEAEAQVEGRRGSATLVVGSGDPLVSPYAAALGYIPPEVASLQQAFAEEAWEVDDTPSPRHTGAAGLCVPDLTFRHRESGREVALELFHAWHAHALERRLEELRTRPDAGLLLGVERALLKDAGRAAALEAHPQVVLFRSFPSPRRVREALERAVGL